MFFHVEFHVEKIVDISSKNILETHGFDSENDQFLKRSHPMVAQKVQKKSACGGLTPPSVGSHSFPYFQQQLY